MESSRPTIFFRINDRAVKPLKALTQPVASLTGIGAQTAKRLEKLGIYQIQQLLFHLPHRYEDRTQVFPIGSLSAGKSALVCGRIELTDVLSRGRSSLICRISDGSGWLTLRFFHFSAKQRMNLEAGTLISCFGEIRDGFAGLEMIHPEYKRLSAAEDCITESCLTPVYPLTEGLRQATIRKAVKQALMLATSTEQSLIDWIPATILEELHYPTLNQALLTLHAPDEKMSMEDFQQGTLPALKRLAFEEFLAHHLSQLLAKKSNRSWLAPVLNSEQKTIDAFIDTLPYNLTAAQLRVINEIAADCAQSEPMMRLIQGDVGSGKTVVSACAAILAIESGYQVAIMAPTELLAEQHFNNFSQWFDFFNTRIVCLTGQLKGKQREDILKSIENNSVKVIIGTHALFQEAVKFSRLGLVIIDEQHRFGVNQRLALRDKGTSTDTKPHQLIMTATPIPRTLAMLNYSDLDISVIDQLPPGRKPVITSAISAERRPEVIQRITGWIQQGRQAYWVCTLIEDSEHLQNEAAEKTFSLLCQALPEVRIALIHGRMKTAEKEQTMQAFKQHETDLLVATTVIEVGVDVPNAGLMIIENPERLGLSQLHQLRGRVGRGSDDSYCLLMYQSPLSETARHRLAILRETGDGFLIAEKDLELRGPGEMMGTRQTGQIQFKIADIERDVELLDRVQQVAAALQSQYPETVQPIIHRWLGGTTHYAEV